MRQLARFIDIESFSGRVPTYIIIIFIVVLAVSLSKIELTTGNVGAIPSLKQTSDEKSVTAVIAAKSVPLTLPTQLNKPSGAVFMRAAVPHTIIPDRNAGKLEIITYVVKSGDTIFGIALKFGLAPETISWSNGRLEDNPDLLQVGQELIILPLDGVYHQVGSGDTIESIAGVFKVDAKEIIDFSLNELDPEKPIIQPGQWLVVPGGSKPFVPRIVTSYSGPIPQDATTGTGAFGWPTSGSITQGYWSNHTALDIGAWLGAAILSSDSGHVVLARWDDMYGNYVIIDHGNGFRTLYAHMQLYYVKAGDNVAKGEQIGEMGSSGNSTGPHLHFEIRQGRIQRNPIGFLP